MILSNVKLARPQSAELGIAGSLSEEIHERWKDSCSGPAGRGAIMGAPSTVARPMSIRIPHAQISHARGETPVMSGLLNSGLPRRWRAISFSAVDSVWSDGDFSF